MAARAQPRIISSTQLTASISANDISSVSSAINVTVVNPGGMCGSPPSAPACTSAAAQFTVGNPVPTITSFSPPSATAYTSAFTLTVNGAGFVQGAVINWNGTALTTAVVNGSCTKGLCTQLQANITASQIAVGANISITVTNPTPGGGASALSTFVVSNPQPVVSALSQNSVIAGAAGFNLTVTGSGFVPNASTVQFNGTNLTPTTVNSAGTSLTVAIPASAVTTPAATFDVTVTNPVPGGGTSAVSAGDKFTIYNPTITALSPSAIGAGSADFPLTITGSNFVTGSPGATVQFGTTNLTVTSLTSTQIVATVMASLVTSPGTVNVTVTDPAPSGGTAAVSAPFTFTINSDPSISSLSPANISAGSGDFTLTVNGSNFVSGATVQWNGNNRATTFVNSSQLTAAISASDVASAGTITVKVVNPDKGASATTNFVVNVAPTITSLSPNNVNAGSADFPLTVNGSNFASGATVQWNGNSRTTTYVTSSKVTAAILASDVASPGTAAVTVLNLDGGISPPATFTINNPVPAITSLSPGWAALGSDGFTLTMTGTNFVPASIVSFNDNTLAGASVNGAGTSLTVTVPKTALASAGAFSVSVTNPSPGGGSSGSLTFFVVGVSAMASVASDGKTQGDGDSQFGVISPDGRFVAFASDASTLVSGAATNGKRNVYLRDTCPTGATGCSGPSTILVSVSDSPAGPNDDSSLLPDEIAITSDGRFIAFASNASNLVAGDANSVKDVFLRDTCNGASGCTASTTLISVATSGAQSNQPSSSPAISTNGQYVAFISYSDNSGTPNPLVVSSLQTATRIYLRDTRQFNYSPGSGKFSQRAGHHLRWTLRSLRRWKYCLYSGCNLPWWRELRADNGNGNSAGLEFDGSVRGLCHSSERPEHR